MTGSLQELREQTKQKNDEVKELSQENRRKITDLKSVLQQASELRKVRDAANAKVKELSPRRKQIQQEQKKIVAELKAKQAELRKFPLQDPRRSANLAKVIEQMEWRLQTEGLSPKQEKELSLEISKLEKERKSFDQAEPVKKEIHELRTKLNVLNEEFEKLDPQFREAFKTARDAHEKTITLYRKADAAKNEISAGFKTLEEKAREADTVYGELSKARDESREHAKARYENAQQGAHAREQSHRDNERQKMEREQRRLEQEQEKIFEALKAGKKIVL